VGGFGTIREVNLGNPSFAKKGIPNQPFLPLRDSEDGGCKKFRGKPILPRRVPKQAFLPSPIVTFIRA
jgi:hypothetical protein